MRKAALVPLFITALLIGMAGFAVGDGGQLTPGGGRSSSEVFGSGVDGVLVFDGTSTVLGIVPSGSAYTLPRDIMPSKMTVNSGVTINAAGYRIFVQGTLGGAGTIRDIGVNASGRSPGFGRAAGLFHVECDGAFGGTFGQTGGQGNASNATPFVYVPAGSGGTGNVSVSGGVGRTSAGGGGGGATGVAGGGNGGALSNLNILGASIPLLSDWRRGGQGGDAQNVNVGAYTLASGGGGGGGGTTDGGGGGSGGGYVFVAANTLTGSITYSVVGGNGAAAAACSSNTNACGGGGGGGGGGYLVIAYETNRSGSVFLVAGGIGGAGGSNSGTAGSGTAGGDGGGGVLVKYNLSADGT